MVFGIGPHRCVGDMLARIEMEESLAAILEAAPGIALETLPEMLGFGGLRQITPMQVRIPQSQPGDAGSPATARADPL